MRVATAPPTPRTRIRRIAERGRYDADTVREIVDAAWYCHVAFVDEGGVHCIPMACWPQWRSSVSARLQWQPYAESPGGRRAGLCDDHPSRRVGAGAQRLSPFDELSLGRHLRAVHPRLR